MSPDGRKLAFLSGGKLWVHFLESGETRDLTAANGVPFWSPDSRWIGYALRGRANLTMLRIEATGGVPSTVAETTGWGGATWNQDGLIIVSDGNAISRVPAAGGTPVQLIQRDRGRRESLVYAPKFLPDGRHFIYTRRSADPKNNAIMLAAVDGKSAPKPLVQSFWGAQYTPSPDGTGGHLLFMRGNTLMAQPLDIRRLELTGEAGAPRRWSGLFRLGQRRPGLSLGIEGDAADMDRKGWKGG
jgi:Tol biopolymer transport system component